jgi:hypothetical protein
VVLFHPTLPFPSFPSLHTPHTPRPPHKNPISSTTPLPRSRPFLTTKTSWRSFIHSFILWLVGWRMRENRKLINDNLAFNGNIGGVPSETRTERERFAGNRPRVPRSDITITSQSIGEGINSSSHVAFRHLTRKVAEWSSRPG